MQELRLCWEHLLSVCQSQGAGIGLLELQKAGGSVGRLRIYLYVGLDWQTWSAQNRCWPWGWGVRLVQRAKELIYLLHLKCCTWAWYLPVAGGKMTCDTELCWNKMGYGQELVSSQKSCVWEDEDRNWLRVTDAGEQHACEVEEGERRERERERLGTAWGQMRKKGNRVQASEIRYNKNPNRKLNKS